MYKVEVGRQAAKDLKRVYRADRKLYQRFLNSFNDISKDPGRGKALQGDLKGLLSYRMGSYRILYEVHHARILVVVIDLGHRRDIYK